VACLEEETILGFIEGRLDRDGLVRVETHARGCLSCDELIAAAMSRPAFADSTPGAIQPGTRIARYTVIDLVGVGGMSEVYLAHDPELDRQVAVKVMRRRWAPHAVRDARQENLLAKEAQATARLRHPNVISVHDMGTFGARVFIAMEYVEGQTLAAWLREKRRSWREILPVFVDAARGLRAAHAAGLVHRDFKPQNVMVGRDGLVRVMDFGVATRIDRGAAAAGPADADADAPGVRLDGERGGERSSLMGKVVGTPTYMAPEQRRGEAADARSDQFSYCVALYQALYGEHPFVDGGRAADLPAAATVNEALRLKGTAARGAVPAWLRRVVTRGLSARREQRWPSMDALLSAIARHQNGVRPRVIIGVGLALACVAVAIAVVATSSRRAVTLCLERSRRVADVWSTGADSVPGAQRRAGVLATLRASRLTGVAETADRVSSVLDRYADEWRGMYRDVCGAANTRHDQSSALLDLRVACLDDSYAALESLTGLLAAANANAVTSAVDAAYALPALDRCEAVSLRHAASAPKATPEVTAQGADIRRRAMEAREAYDTGDPDRALAHGESLLAEARQLGYPPLVAELLLMLGRFNDSSGLQPRQNERLHEAINLAVRAQRDDIAAEACVLLGGNAVLFNHMDEAQTWLGLGEAMADRVGAGQARLRAWIVNDRANIMATGGHYEEALRLHDQALAMKSKLFPPEHPDILRSMVSQAETLHRAGRNQEAVAISSRAVRYFKEVYGAHSPFAAHGLSNRGEYLLELGSNEQALASFQESLAIWEDGHSEGREFLPYPLTGRGRALIALGRPAEAMASLERAGAIRDATGASPPLKAETEFPLAQAQWATGQHTLALRTATAAERDFRDDPNHQKDADDVRTWLAGHAAPPPLHRVPPPAARRRGG
jgi:tetratricopeptide (TPR) repeat protein/tRNA A-37 threonylcarbamoyl transferase component Bud32